MMHVVLFVLHVVLFVLHVCMLSGCKDDGNGGGLVAVCAGYECMGGTHG